MFAEALCMYIQLTILSRLICSQSVVAIDNGRVIGDWMWWQTSDTVRAKPIVQCRHANRTAKATSLYFGGFLIVLPDLPRQGMIRC